MPTAATLSLPEDASLLTRLRTGWQALEVLKDAPEDPIAGPLLNACLDKGVYAALIRQLQQSEEGRQLLAERPSLQGSTLDLPALERLPPGTLGHEFARYYRDNGIKPFESTFEVKNDIDYISKRYRETHDLFHVVTGYGTDVVGEMELQAFAQGNLGIHTALLILLFSVPMQLKERTPGFGWRAYGRRLWAAWRRGSRSQRLIGFRFERHWETPVTVLRSQLCAPVEA